jgi:hypothetical protein
MVATCTTTGCLLIHDWFNLSHFLASRLENELSHPSATRLRSVAALSTGSFLCASVKNRKSWGISCEINRKPPSPRSWAAMGAKARVRSAEASTTVSGAGSDYGTLWTRRS